MRLSAIALAIATMSSVARAQVDPGPVDICVNSVCEPIFPVYEFCVCDFERAKIEECVEKYWSPIPGGIVEIERAYLAIQMWCSDHGIGEGAV
ncbi:uncharacterized protein SCHCODRAFT_02372730 [Schizophyllum commune H4-8]|nr:uncharacterized protein SCHCODRAFT_02372730 [Schizophyllum commune H4-8]KAI5889637.1 hypothetical protein SCHCODRAFT_02372730 [Schizophyllum commune H4-8]